MPVRIAASLLPLVIAVPAAAQQPAPAPAADTEDDDHGEIVVLGTRRAAPDRAIAPDLATQVLSQSSRSIEADLIRDHGARRLNDALELVSGVSRQNNLGGLRDNFAIRGFLGTPDTGAEYYVDGFLANRGFGPPRDPALVERIEVLKGPAGALFGEIDPAGRVNVVQKTPSFTPAATAAFSYGSFDTARAELDATGGLTDTIAARLVIAAERSDGYRDRVDLRRTVAAPSLTWQPTDATRLTYSGEWLRFATPFDRGVPALNGDTMAVPYDRFFGEPADGRVASRNMRQQLTLSQRLGSDWSLNGGVAWRHGRLTGFSSEQSLLVAGPALRRQRRYRDFEVDDVSGRIELSGRFEALGTHHPALGLRGYALTFDERQWRRSPTAAAPYAISVTDPRYGATTLPLLPFTDQTEHRRAVAAYAQDMWDVTDRLTLDGGIRLDSWRQRYENRRTGRDTSAARNPLDGRVAARYRLDDHLALHASYGESYRANSSTGRTGEPFAPERGHGWEAGVAFRRPGIDAAVTYFDIDKSNILAIDPADVNFLAPVGELRSRGVEVDASATLPGGTRLVGNYAWVHARVDDARFPSARVLNVPEHQANLFVSAPIVARVRASAGATYQSRRAAAIDGSGLTLPAFLRARAAVDVDLTDRLSLRGEVDNLFDETYADSSYSPLWILPAPRRSVRVTLTVRS